MRSFSPAGALSPTWPRNFSAVRFSPLRSAFDVGRQFRDAVVEARNGDAAVVVVHCSKDFAQHPQRILRSAAEQAGMQVAVRAGQPNFLIDQPAQRRGDRRRLLVPHAGVADQRQIELELVGIVADEIKQVLGAALLLALDHHGDRQRQRAGHRLVGAASFDESHSLPLIVAGAAGNNYFSAVGQRLHPRLERRMGPLVERVDRLHVVVTIEEDARLAIGFSVAGFPDHDRVAFRRRTSAAKPMLFKSRRRIQPRRDRNPYKADRSRPIGCATARTGDRGLHQIGIIRFSTASS
jgi:hypothetical protein